ncbi:hypothetical protein FQN49_004037 [Arthroderma sp. PD_2]|nr:hypothetical protein FQN49_004037 [Arthroderma sp. PD_2]
MSNGPPQSQNQSPASQETVAWSELFLQHELNINKHLELCSKVRQHVSPSGVSFQAISSMIAQSQRFIEEVKKLRQEFMPQSTGTRLSARPNSLRYPEASARSRLNGVSGSGEADNIPSAKGESPSFIFDADPTPPTATQRSQNRKKRSRNLDDSLIIANSHVRETPSLKKTKLLPRDPPAADGSISNQPSSIPQIELEDISQEVEARLKLREETRRKKGEKRRKRKRGSIGSLAAGSRESAPQAKRARKS